MSIKEGDIIQAWSETEYKCLGWGKIIKVAYSEETKEGIPLIQLESGKTIWGDRCGWITEKKAVEIGLSIFLNTMGRKFG
ncbi:MAG: hypothetical protein KAR42_16670 [candidate division Zixibacteria bacterium]|nr:hypothetical protein [candidate division Zixibacteria bacterium]